jgi:adenylate kinase family enzyme
MYQSKIEKEEKTSENVSYNPQLKEIAELIAKNLGNKIYDKDNIFYVITKEEEKLYELSEYEELLKSNPNISKPFIFISNIEPWFAYDPVLFNFPLLVKRGRLIDAYLMKQEFKTLKYFAIFRYFQEIDQAFIEVVDIETATKNLNLPKLIQILYDINEDDNEEVINEKLEEFREQFESQKLFGKYDFLESEEILDKYYNKNDKSLINEVEDIYKGYQSVYQSYRILISPT